MIIKCDQKYSYRYWYREETVVAYDRDLDAEYDRFQSKCIRGKIILL